MDYKQEHEAYLSGLTGSSVWIVVYVGVSITLINGVRQRLDIRNTSVLGKVVLDILFLDLPMLILLCFPTTYAVWMNIVFALLFVILLVANRQKESKILVDRNKLPYLTVYRSSLLLMTCLAILAVDFRIFPRYFAKTETFGYSLMDAGVGCFVFSNAIVSKTARVSGETKTQSTYPYRLYKSIHGVSPLLVLGFIRLFTTKASNYQEHTSEYGVHWNFFFTLSAVALFVSFLDLSAKNCPIVAFAILIGYQLCLWYGLENWILNAPRNNLITMNKEGICSSFGFLSICLLGTWVGSILFSHKSTTASESQLVKKLVALDIFFWLLCFGLDVYISPSRRMANITYVMFIVAFNLLLVILFKLLEKVSAPIESLLIDGLSRNGLIMFLIANLLTGATNLSMRTLYASNPTAFIILGAYLIVLTCISAFFHVMNITLKFCPSWTVENTD